MMKPASVIELINDRLLDAQRTERNRLDKIDRWYRWEHPDHKIPRQATPEHKALLELSKTPWLGLVVTTVAQSMYVDGYRSPSNPDNSQAWRTWEANDWGFRQVPVHRAALAYGYSYAKVLPGELNGAPTSVLRGVSPRKAMAFYGDEVEDDWPLFFLQVDKQGDGLNLLLTDETHEYRVSREGVETGKYHFIEAREHGAGLCPVVRYTNMLDLDGRSPGEVEPFIPVAARINKTSYDRMLTQHFNSWKVLTVTGMEEPETEAEANRTKLKLRQGDILVAEDPDTKFGTLDETPLDGFIRAWESDIEALAAVTQTPSHNLTGKMVNLSAEALAAARASLTQKVAERQRSFGKSHDQLLRLAAALEGDEVGAQDVMAHVTWQDMEIRSMAQAVDALGKAATMLGIPPQALWGRIPGVTKSDVDEWTNIASRGDQLTKLYQLMSDQTGGADGSDSGSGGANQGI